MGEKISFIASAAISRGDLIDLTAEPAARSYPTASAGNMVGVCLEDVASGSYGTFWSPGSTNVYTTAEGAVNAGDIVVPATGSGHEGWVAATGSIDPTLGTSVAGTAMTDATNGNPVYISFIPVNF